MATAANCLLETSLRLHEEISANHVLSYHLRVALLRDEKITQPVGIALGALAGAGLEYCRQRDDYSLIAAGKTEFEEDI